ncbi:unnamed protein product [Adineta ricciae]|uniref:G-protein coupled receptors family 1 profile domain-containing protein n=1 Tax=Adineta ricciae TaxID=249248 RepID=A0A814GMN3_ADIRI|nr:unnamed protein product [Adineta ricciae]CAF1245151.1 unnamed protein product [Adineta ricciae]
MSSSANDSIENPTRTGLPRSIVMTIILYLIVNLCVHILFFLTTVYHNYWQIFQISKSLTDTTENNLNSTLSLDIEQSSSDVLQLETSRPCLKKKIFSTSSSSSSSLLSHMILESETMLIRTIRSFGLFLVTSLLIVNWLCLIIYLYPIFYPNSIQYPTTLCLVQSFSLHVLTLFHLNLTITIRLFWYLCFKFNQYWQTITYRRLCVILFVLFVYICIFTWPTITDEWASIRFDSILEICIVNYIFRLSYTFFVLSFTCFIPYSVLILTHYRQMKCIQRRIIKYLLTFKIDQHQQGLIYEQQKRFQSASSIILIWTLCNILLLISIHVPIEHQPMIKSIIFYIQMLRFVLDPILYMFVFRSLSIITLLRPTSEVYF